MKRATLITILFATVAVYGCSSGGGDGTAGSGGTAGTGGSGTAGTGGSGTAGTGGSGTAGTGGSGTAGTGGSGTAGTGGSGTAGTGGSGTAGTGGSGTAGTGGSGTAGTGGSGTAGTGGSGTAGTGGSGTAGTGGSGTAGTGGSAGAGGGGTAEYEQDFEAAVPGNPPQPVPNSLSEDGWLVFGNVFAADGTTFLYDYVPPCPCPAPNGGEAFSAVAVGEGGAAQGAQQLSIYNDYNNADHGNGSGNVIEAIVFRERTIVADDVGTTLTFTFDAKAGNIEGATTALAFVKTLDPGAGFATVDFFTEDTTNLPATWGTFTLSLPIDASRVGYILQYGFQSRASNSEGSGIFYDNIEVTESPTP